MTKLQENLYMNLKQFASFVLNAYYINVTVKFDDFFLTVREKKPIHVPIVENLPSLESAQCTFLDHSETEKPHVFVHMRIRLLECSLFLLCIFPVRKSILRKRRVCDR